MMKITGIRVTYAIDKCFVIFIVIAFSSGILYSSEMAMDKIKGAADILCSIWGAGGILITVGASLFGFFKRKTIRKVWYLVFDFLHGKYAIQELAKKKLVLGDGLSELRTIVRILVVDDNTIAREGMVEQLKGLGYKMAKGHYPITLNDDAVKESQILVIDINNVYFGYQKPLGEVNQGLEVAQAIKYAFPVKKILAYTGNLDDYKGNVILEKVVDDKFEKGDDLSVIVKKVDECIRELFEPDKFWMLIRNELFANGEKTKDVAKLENTFVRVFIREEALSLVLLKSALKKVSSKSLLAEAMIKSIDTIS